MPTHVDRKYLGLIQYRLERFTQKNTNLFNFRCPFCLDSKKSKSKARGYIYCKSNDYFYRCHNCGVSINFGHFLKSIDITTYKQYMLEQYTEGRNAHAPVEKPAFEDLRGNAFEQFTNLTKGLSISKISELPENHYARDYILNRHIPEKFWNEIYYTDKFKDFMDNDFPNHGKEDVPNDDRIVLLYTDENGDIVNVAGRALSNTKMRYVSIKIRDGRKIFGCHRLDVTKPAVIVEGQFDSMFIDNCVATGDSSLHVVADQYPDVEWTIVYDRESRNKDIVKQIKIAIDRGYKVCLLPESGPDYIPGKDINEMIINGLKPEDLMNLVTKYSYKGLVAQMEFNRWKKC